MVGSLLSGPQNKVPLIFGNSHTKQSENETPPNPAPLRKQLLKRVGRAQRSARQGGRGGEADLSGVRVQGLGFGAFRAFLTIC